MNANSYIGWLSMTDKNVSELLGLFVRHHRLNQNRTQAEVSKDAGISRSTLSLLEKGEVVTIQTLIQVLRVLNLLDVFGSFKVDEQVSPILLAKMQAKKRLRSRGKNDSEAFKSDW